MFTARYSLIFFPPFVAIVVDSARAVVQASIRWPVTVLDPISNSGLFI
jgi:hypothetical protein